MPPFLLSIFTFDLVFWILLYPKGSDSYRPRWSVRAKQIENYYTEVQTDLVLTSWIHHMHHR